MAGKPKLLTNNLMAGQPEGRRVNLELKSVNFI